jgi:hypothetical protein
MMAFNTNLASGMFRDVIGMYNNYQMQEEMYSCRDVPPRLINVHPRGIPVFHWQRIDDIQKSTSPVVAVDMLGESLCIRAHLDKCPQDRQYLLWANGCWDQNLDLGFEYRLITCNMLMYLARDASDHMHGHNFFVDKKYFYEGVKPNLFCCLIGTERLERSLLVQSIKSELNYQNYILNYNGVELGRPSRHLDVKYDFSNFDPYRPAVLSKNHYNSLGWTLPLKLFNTSRFNLVVETSQIPGDHHVTEKTLRPLIIGQPFVVYASPGHLKNLRSLGFRTFHDLWDEGYDDIENYALRVSTLVDLLNDLKNFNWVAHQDELKAITNHNQLVLTNIGHTLAAREMRDMQHTLDNCPWIPRQ